MGLQHPQYLTLGHCALPQRGPIHDHEIRKIRGIRQPVGLAGGHHVHLYFGTVNAGGGQRGPGGGRPGGIGFGHMNLQAGAARQFVRQTAGIAADDESVAALNARLLENCLGLGGDASGGIGNRIIQCGLARQRGRCAGAKAVQAAVVGAYHEAAIGHRQALGQTVHLARPHGFASGDVHGEDRVGAAYDQVRTGRDEQLQLRSVEGPAGGFLGQRAPARRGVGVSAINRGDDIVTLGRVASISRRRWTGEAEVVAAGGQQLGGFLEGGDMLAVGRVAMQLVLRAEVVEVVHQHTVITAHDAFAGDNQVGLHHGTARSPVRAGVSQRCGATTRNVELVRRGEQVALRRERHIRLAGLGRGGAFPKRLPGGGVERGHRCLAGGENSRTAIRHATVHQDARAHRPQGTHPPCAENARGARARPCAPQQAAVLGVEAIHQPVI